MRSLVAILAISFVCVAKDTYAQRNLIAVRAVPTEQRVALVVGNAAYKDSPLRNPVNDATDMAAELRKLGFLVTLLTDTGPREMRAAIREFSQSLKKGGVGLFYFAGHGVQAKGRNFLIPVNADIREEFELEDEAIDANRVLAGMEDAGNRVNIVILDACRNNPFARSWRSASRGLAQMSAPAGSFVAFATAPGSVAADGSGRNGVFTENLLKSLREPDTDIDRVFTRVTAGVARVTSNKQVPWKSSSLTGEFRFRGGDVAENTGQAVATIQTDALANDRAFWESVKDTKNPVELKAYLDNFPAGLFVALAKARLSEMESDKPAKPVAIAALASAIIAPTRPIQETVSTGSIASMAPGSVFRDCPDCPEMVVVPPGRFIMGSPANEAMRDWDEGPQHEVIISRPLAIGRFEVTFDQWEACLRDGACRHNPEDDGTGRGKRPVVNVSWEDTKTFTAWLARKSGKNYRLLSEAEWEYAARGGTTTAFFFGNRLEPNRAHHAGANSYAGSSIQSSPRWGNSEVGAFAPNAFGLFDMHGNVWEWTEDCFNPDYRGAPTNGSAWTSGDCSRRVIRGGDWFNPPENLRSAHRSGTWPNDRQNVGGFRVARSD